MTDSALSFGSCQAEITEPGPKRLVVTIGSSTEHRLLFGSETENVAFRAGVVTWWPSGAGCHAPEVSVGTESWLEGLTAGTSSVHNKCMPTTPTHRYERVSYRVEGQRRPRVLLLENVRVLRLTCGAMLVGTEVDEAGEIKWFAKGTAEREHMISADLVNRRQVMTMNYELGVLEIADSS